ncbi:MAG: hypothetical protein KA143_12035, partial [Saprospiraceae bacterium]|nr:hypothetical protein [Saprospiraceae bacterium]
PQWLQRSFAYRITFGGKVIYEIGKREIGVPNWEQKYQVPRFKDFFKKVHFMMCISSLIHNA